MSVVIPTRDRPEALGRCLAGLAATDSASQLWLEVIVVDDGGHADLDEALRQARTLDLLAIRGCGRGPAGARNVGASAARASLLAFLDDDTIVEPGWLDAMFAAHEEQPQAILGGRVDNGLPGNPYSTASQAILTAAYRYYERSGAMRLFTTTNLGVPAAGFDSIDGFDERFRISAEDYDLCFRWQRAGRPAAHASGAAVRHFHPLTLRAFCHQHFRYGRGATQFRARAGNAPEGGGRSWLGLLARLAWEPLRRHGPRVAALVALSQVAAAAGGVRERAAAGAYRSQAVGARRT